MYRSVFIFLIGILLYPAGCDMSSDPGPPDDRAEARCVDGVFTSGALYRVCIPDNWSAGNDDLIIFSPGYTNPRNALSIVDWQIPQHTMTLSDVIRLLGFGFATTSFRDNGLLEPEWISEDLHDLVNRFVDEFGYPRYTYLVGFSQGGMITTLGVEQYPSGAGGHFDGGLAACGPLGDFQLQFDYLGHFRVVFDYKFHEQIENWPVWSQDIEAGDTGYMDQILLDQWASRWVPHLSTLVRDTTHAESFEHLLSMTGAPADWNSVFPMENTLLQVLWYGVFGTNDAIEKLGGLPFDNSDYVYSGSGNDEELNDKVERFRMTGNAQENIKAITATGYLRAPLVTMHTTGDEVVPNDHALEFEEKVIMNQADRYHTHFEIERYGHCNFTFEEILAAFTVLVEDVTAKSLEVPVTLFDNELQQLRYLDLVRLYGRKPVIVSN